MPKEDYKILEKIGEGGMGAVYRAECLNYINNRAQKETIVAIKVLHPELIEKERFRDRSLAEAHSLELLDGGMNIIEFVESFEYEGIPWIVTEYLDGVTLGEVLSEGKGLPLDRALNIFQQVLVGIGFAHTVGVIHRDIKPSNIMVCTDDKVKIMDFGISDMVGNATLTKPGRRIGTLWYMSPEQHKGDMVTFRSDIYALGLLLYEMTLGRQPFITTDDYQIRKDHIEKKPPKPTDLDPEYPSALEHIVLKCLKKRPDDRFRRIFDLSDSIREIRNNNISTEKRSGFPKEEQNTQKLSLFIPLFFIVLGLSLVVTGVVEEVILGSLIVTASIGYLTVHHQRKKRKELIGYLLTDYGLYRGLKISLPMGGIKIGRGQNRCQIVIPNTEESVSREHAWIGLYDGAVHVVDLNSRNGTFINNRKISGATKIGDSARISLGSSRVVFTYRGN